MGFSGKKWELIGDRGIYRNYGRYTLSWGLNRAITVKYYFVKAYK